MSASADAAAAVRRFESETNELRDAPEPRWARSTVFALAAMLLVLGAVLFLTRFDRVVESEGGKIISTERASIYQALDPSIIKSIDVHEGDEVTPGQLLATLDPTFTLADVRQLRQQVASLETQIARDEAQINDKPLVFADNDDPDYQRYAALQKTYYDQQVAQYTSQIASYDAKIEETNATIAKYQADASRYQDRENIAKQIEEIQTTLAAHGTGSKVNMLTSQDQRYEVLRSLEYSHNSLVEAQQTLASLTADRNAFIKQWSAQLSQDLLTARNNLDVARSQLDKATRRQDLVRLTAREPSVVLSVAKLSVGSVLKQGDALFELMPLDAPVAAEIKISSRDVGFVRAGDPCALKVSAFNYMEHGLAEGKVRWISDNAFTTSDDGQVVPAYYKARCTVDAMRFRDVPAKFRLIPGMTLNADLKVGTRSAAMYLLSGILRGFGESMREP